MKRFKNNQRVVVSDPDPDHAALRGTTGVVTRLLMRDKSAWVNIEAGMPDHLRRFPASDPGGRGNYVLLWPEECEPEKP